MVSTKFGATGDSVIHAVDSHLTRLFLRLNTPYRFILNLRHPQANRRHIHLQISYQSIDHQNAEKPATAAATARSLPRALASAYRRAAKLYCAAPGDPDPDGSHVQLWRCHDQGYQSAARLQRSGQSFLHVRSQRALGHARKQPFHHPQGAVLHSAELLLRGPRWLPFLRRQRAMVV